VSRGLSFRTARRLHCILGVIPGRKQGNKSSSKSGIESNESVAEEEEEISEDRGEPFAGAAPADEFREEEEEDGEDDWIIQDNVDIDSLELPEEFSMASHQDLGHHFKSQFAARNISDLS
jgi:hypothetical protein